MSKANVPLLIGPTASGKTDLSLRIAGSLPVEIVSADSRQIYKHMDIGTAKPGTEELRRVSHHCIDIVEPDVVFSAGQYGTLARAIGEDILSRNKIPLIVGGSGLYIRALVDGIFSGNFKNDEVRKRLSEEVDERGLDVLYRRLQKTDPLSAEKIHSNDRKRIIRALEVFELSGIPVSMLRKEGTEPADFHPLFFGLNWPREVLYDRIERRVDRMMEEGLVREVQKLKDMGFSLQHNAMNSVGYREMVQHLEGWITLDEAVTLIKKNTRRFAKRQMTWFRSNKRIQWLDIREPADLDGFAERIVQAVAHSD
jgi:tRNA dimethylallyltransferase